MLFWEQWISHAPKGLRNGNVLSLCSIPRMAFWNLMWFYVPQDFRVTVVRSLSAVALATTRHTLSQQSWHTHAVKNITHIR